MKAILRSGQVAAPTGNGNLSILYRRFGSLTARTMTPLTARVAPTNKRPPRNSPVEVRTRPMAYEPKKPPRLPTELINAIPAAAPADVSRLVGIAQNGPIIEKY